MILHCPECNAEWPEFLQHEHDMLEVDSFSVGDDGAWIIDRDPPEYLDHHEFACTACLKVVIESAEGEDLDELYQSLLESMPPDTLHAPAQTSQ